MLQLKVQVKLQGTCYVKLTRYGFYTVSSNSDAKLECSISLIINVQNTFLVFDEKQSPINKYDKHVLKVKKKWTMRCMAKKKNRDVRNWSQKNRSQSIYKFKSITGLKFGGDKICNNGEIKSSIQDFVEICLEMHGEIFCCQDLRISIFSIRIVRYLKDFTKYNTMRLLILHAWH